MTTIRKVRRSNFTVVDNAAVEDARLSFRARGLLTYMLAKPDGWAFSATRMAAQGKEGRGAILTALKELEVLGYLIRTRHQGIHGLWSTIVEVHEVPPPESDYRTSVNRTSVSSTLKQRPLAKTQEPHTRATYPDAFETTWKHYPRKLDKSKAFKAWQARIREGVTPDTIAMAVVHYAASRTGQDPTYTKHGSTFFGADRPYEDWVGGDPEPKRHLRAVDNYAHSERSMPSGPIQL